MTVTDLKEVCGFAPSVWTFRTFEDRPAYVRLRWNGVRVGVGAPGARCNWENHRDEDWTVYDGGVNLLEWSEMSDSPDTPSRLAVKVWLTLLPDEVPSYARHNPAEVSA